MTSVSQQLTREQLRKVWVEISIEPTPYHQLERELQGKKDRLEELRNTPMITDYRIR